jgi:hypothetical protein
VEREYAERALARMADASANDPDSPYPILRRLDLGPDTYEAVEDSARSH